ncbi:MAG TPA: S8 family peptidase [Thermoflexales bacterium]|nr:S8 family peptidase [Thermoflexales bacterium]
MFNKFNKTFTAFVVGFSLFSGGVSAQTQPAPLAASSGPNTRQIIIKFGSAAQRETAAPELNALAGESVEFVRLMAGGAEVWRLTTAKSQAEVENIAARIATSSLVEYAEADAIMHAYDRPLPDQPLSALLTPNDTYFGNQWHYKAPSSGDYGIDAVGAWDITTGSSTVNVAVIDTGALFNHPDMTGKWLPGYDMISDSYISRDGDGRDSDASDMGDWTTSGDCGDSSWQPSDSSWHGTHVAGTIGAASNNGVGVTGVSWQSRVVPVRVLGRCGGYTSDIADGMYWAAGLSVAGAPANPNPAKVLNMSLGGSGACGTTYQNAVDAIRNAGATVVVAAGNENVNVSNARPANCTGVIAIAATGRDGKRAYYSNYGSLVTLAAPGGDQSSGAQNGILSTLNSGLTSPGQMAYAYYQGTSMATPHVAGIIALMLARNNSLTPDQIKTILKQTVTPFPSGSTCNTSICGVGIANAKAAVQAVSGASGARKVFLPLLSRAGSVTPPTGGAITGLIEDAGATASDIQVVLVKRVGPTDTPVLTTTTNSAGRYTFNNMPALGSGESYFVKFTNENDSTRLYYWRTRLLSAFGASDTVDLGTFDVSNVELLYPSDDATITLPETFYWSTRGISGDSYSLHLYNSDGTTYAATNPLGDVSSFEMTSLPTGFVYNTPYAWEVGIVTPDGALGLSFAYYTITFTE